MDLTSFARSVSNYVLLIPPIAYAVLLFDATNFFELLVVAFVFFAFLPQWSAERRLKVRTQASKLQFILDLLVFFAIGLVAFFWLQAPSAVIAFSLSLAAGHVLAYLITPYWLISTHAMLTAQPMAILILENRLEALPFLAIFLIMGWARVHLKAHTPAQYLVGGVVGVLLTYIAVTGVGI